LSIKENYLVGLLDKISNLEKMIEAQEGEISQLSTSMQAINEEKESEIEK
jgi:hypothetical protein